MAGSTDDDDRETVNDDDDIETVTDDDDRETVTVARQSGVRWRGRKTVELLSH